MQNKRFHLFLWPVLISVCSGCAESTTAVRQSEPLTMRRLDQDTIAADEQLKKLAADLPSRCNEVPDPKQAQYIIGYGSLMQDESRRRSVPHADTAYPVMVKGFRRGWLAKGPGVGFDATYLGIVSDQDGRFNAVLYQISPNDIPVMDNRESFYCRLAVEPARYSLLKTETPIPQGQVWIYANKPESVATANERHPIVQSYVDIFVSGCLEQEQRYALENFAKQCLTTTSHWSTAWVNDRLYPRRPYIYQPKASQIDKLLQQQLPDYFRQIHIESAK